MSTDLTRTSAGARDPSQSTPRGGRFVAGTVLASRYRIVGLLGAGGMGEVYKADDLKLDHPVALKFLPETLALSPGALARFHAEVRIARQVSHPNVCRVYDIGDIDGLQFLTMEFIDGEDLASLIRRIGRLPADKALELARQMCAGLAAAHDAGVLHRDLKPHNVMIDGRGRARVTDFGLAALVRDVRAEHVVAGTPAYMAPEQLRGEDTTVRSDIYALGLVLYELFTGKRAIQVSSMAEAVMHHSAGSVITTPSEVVRDLDPLVERVILRCLDKDPALRPASAIQVAAALPGGDPLQAALAAGETPSPEMVAAAGSSDAMRPAVALGIAATAIAIIIGVAIASSQFSILGHVAGDASPEVLTFRARQMLMDLGYPDRGRDSAAGFERETSYLSWDFRNQPGSGRIERLAGGRPAALHFWYRESPEPLFPILGAGQPGAPRVPPVDLDNPSASVRGMRYLRLDMQGRLNEFGAIPAEDEDAAMPNERAVANEPPEPSGAQGAPWAALFKAAGLDRNAFTPTTPSWTPLAAIDERAAWTGAYPERPDLPLRLEAAAYRGRLVSYRVFGPWTSTSTGRSTSGMVTGIVVFLIFVTSVALAWYNLHTGRGDRRGAIRVGVVVSALGLFAWVLSAHHAAVTAQLTMLRLALSQTLISGLQIALAYLAIEPYVRRRWPAVLVSWSRVLVGRWRDPLVGKDALYGIAIGSVTGLVAFAVGWLNNQTMDAESNIINSFLSTREAAGELLFTTIAGAIAIAFLFTVLMFVLRVVVRSTLVAAGLICVLALVVFVSGPTPSTAPIGVTIAASYALALTRFGLVALMSLLAMGRMFTTARAAIAWSPATGAFMLAIIVALVLGAAYLAMGSPKIARATRSGARGL